MVRIDSGINHSYQLQQIAERIHLGDYGVLFSQSIVSTLKYIKNPPQITKTDSIIVDRQFISDLEGESKQQERWGR